MLIRNKEELLSALSSKKIAGIGVVAESEETLRECKRAARDIDAQIVFVSILDKASQRIDLSSAPSVDLWLVAVFDHRAIAIRGEIAKLINSGGKEPELLCPAYDYSPLVEDQRFTTVCENLSKQTPWDFNFWCSWKSYGVFQLLRQALTRDGEIVEFGCYRGYSAAFVAETVRLLEGKSRKIILFDTWQGMPGSSALDSTYKKGDFCDTSLEAVQRVLKPWSGVIEFVKGDITKTVFEYAHPQYCYMRIDVDLYLPTRAALESCYSNVVPGGVIYLDDYVSKNTVGERVAVDEFLVGKQERVFYMLGDRAYIVKGNG